MVDPTARRVHAAPRWDLGLTIGLVVVLIALAASLSFVAAFAGMSRMGCMETPGCDLAGFDAATRLAFWGPIAVTAVAVVAAIAARTLGRVAFWIPLVAGVVVVAIGALARAILIEAAPFW